MCPVAPPPPSSPVELVVDVLHGIPVADPYRWLEDQNSPQTRAWIEEQTRYARSYLDEIPGREQIRERVRALLDVETYDSFLKNGNRYFFRKRHPGEEQPSIYFREEAEGEDQLLLDPATRGTGDFTAVKPLLLSSDGSLLLYEVKQGGEGMGTFEILDVASRTTLPDSLPHGYLRGFAFAPDSKSFYYTHEAMKSERPFYRAAYHHVLGTSPDADRKIFCAGENEHVRLLLVNGTRQLGFIVYRFLERTYTDFYVWRIGSEIAPVPIVRNADYNFTPRFLGARIIAEVDHDAPNRRIVEVQPRRDEQPLLFNLVPEKDALIHSWHIAGNHIVVTYARSARIHAELFDSFGKHMSSIPGADGETLRIAAANHQDDEFLLEHQSFTRPVAVDRCSVCSGTRIPWIRRKAPHDAPVYAQRAVSFPSADGTQIPMALLGREDAFAADLHPVLMTAYGGYGIPVMPQFSVLVTLLVERGCVFSLPNIRGGSEFGTQWHEAAKRQKRQVAFDDFLAAAEWLLSQGRTDAQHLAILGGSNSGLLVAAAMTQRPELFRAVLCLVPLTDMLRYHRFDNAHVWKDEFGIADDPADFSALWKYSPYHHIRPGTHYPATMIVSGDADGKCNALHARKLAARLQAASVSMRPILLDYREQRGHSAVLPLTARIDALTDRVAFLHDQLGLVS